MIDTNTQNHSGVENKVIQALGNVIDPELGIDIVNLGLIYKVSVNNDVCQITMTLTTMGCPISDILHDSITKAVLSVENVVQCRIHLVWKPAWTINSMSRYARIALGIHW
jgi:metal-sulfur cluster biosynthetic enzyme